jgi:hypothetical protein
MATIQRRLLQKLQALPPRRLAEVEAFALIMRVVLDTNTPVSAVLSANGPPSDVG